MNTEAFTVRTDAKTIEFIDSICQQTDRSRNYVVNEALNLYRENEERIHAQIRKGLAQAEAGEGMEHEEFFNDFYKRHNIK